MADPTDETTEEPQDVQAEQQSDAGEEQPASGDPVTGTEEIEQRLDDAAQSLDQAAGENVSTDADAQPFSLDDLSPVGEPGGDDPGARGDQRQPIELIGEVEMDLRIELGRTQMRLEEVLQLRGGSVVALDKLAGDPVDVFVNGRLIARGEVLVMNDNFCIRVTELVGA